jgi:hypothetical protein
VFSILLAVILAAGILAAVIPAGVPTGASAGSSRPRVSAKPPSASASAAGWAASKWSGYALTGGSYTSITGTWTVPAVTPSVEPTYSASWAGIDGFNNNSLIQAGTEQDYYGGTARYYAWWGIGRVAETVISSITVSPGDTMSASISKGTGNVWTITLADVTTGRSFTTSQTYSGPGASAEWIEERPVAGGRIATLANYGKTIFDHATVNGAAPGFTRSDGGVMVQGGTKVSTPSLPDDDGDGFTVAYGATTPVAPAS